MVQKSPGKRGRPRAYDPDAALAQATSVFWKGGYAGTSLDDLAAGTGMNRPSLYGAFGDKHALYMLATQRYREQGRDTVRDILAQGPARAATAELFARAAEFYLQGEHGQRGCFLIGTALTEAVNDTEVRASLGAALDEFDAVFEARFREAAASGELRPGDDPAAMARIAAATLYTMSIRARAGGSRAVLDALAAAAMAVLFGPATAPP